MTNKRRLEQPDLSSDDRPSVPAGARDGSSGDVAAVGSSPPPKRQPADRCADAADDTQLTAVVSELVNQMVQDTDQPFLRSRAAAAASAGLCVDALLASPVRPTSVRFATPSPQRPTQPDELGQPSTSRGTRRARGALRSQPTDGKPKKSVNFEGVTVYYFSRNQGFTCVPSQGGSTLGMDMSHTGQRSFTLDDHQEEKRQVHRQILMRRKRYARLQQNPPQTPHSPTLGEAGCSSAASATGAAGGASDSGDDSPDNLSDISDTELEMDSWYFLQPVPIKQRRALLRESGVNKIDSSEKEDCRDIRLSREYCGCECRIYCDPETCQCSLAGIKCQVDRLSFPCGCSRDTCGNLNGRIEFNPLRVRTHLIHTIMRLGLEKKEEAQVTNRSHHTPLSGPDQPQH